MAKKKIKTIDRTTLPCKFASHYSDSVPMPFGSGNCSMPGFECLYGGDTEIPEDMTCYEDLRCPAYTPVPVMMCEKHQEEYYDVCGACEDEMWSPK